MYTKEDFVEAIKNTISNYPDLAALEKVGDSFLLQNQEAQATVLAMLSTQIEVYQNEPFQKTRDATIRSDAAMRGILPKGTATRVKISVENKGVADVNIGANRVILDADGRAYSVESGTTALAGSTTDIHAEQFIMISETHTVVDTEPFYSIQISSPDDGMYLSRVSLEEIVLGLPVPYEYRERYINTIVGSKAYNIEMDNAQRMFIRLGWNTIVGSQPTDGDVFVVNTRRTFGKIDLEIGGEFSFETIMSPDEPFISMSLSEIPREGADPHDIIALKELTKHPSVYDNSAVQTGSFDFLIRRNHPELQFLSVWNEKSEETVRGANVKNIMTLFVACYASTEAFIDEPSVYSITQPTVIESVDLTPLQLSVKETINRANDTYKIVFYTPVRTEVPIKINATVSSIYDIEAIAGKIKETMLLKYGLTGSNLKRKTTLPSHRDVYKAMHENVLELNEGDADIKMTLGDELINPRPEQWLYASNDKMDIQVTSANISTGSWG